MQVDKRTLDTLEDIRDAIRDIDELRTDSEISDEDRKELELAAVALRDTERLLVGSKQKQVVKELEALSSDLKEYTSSVRDRLQKLNRTARTLDKIEGVLSHILRISEAIEKWL